MNTTMQGDGRIRHIEWPTGIVGGLLLISLGLELLAHQVFGQTDMGTLLWALYLGSWSFVLGTTGFLFLTVQWWVEWRRDRAHRNAMSRLSPAAPRRRHSEKSEQAHPQFLPQDMALPLLRAGRQRTAMMRTRPIVKSELREQLDGDDEDDTCQAVHHVTNSGGPRKG